jgi:hypothetical protein
MHTEAQAVQELLRSALDSAGAVIEGEMEGDCLQFVKV